MMMVMVIVHPQINCNCYGLTFFKLIIINVTLFFIVSRLVVFIMNHRLQTNISVKSFNVSRKSQSQVTHFSDIPSKNECISQSH